MTIVPVLRSDKSDWKPASLSALLALALYAVTLRGTYIAGDDRYLVLEDPRVGDVAQWGQYWTKDYYNGGADNLYRPLVSMSYAIQAKLHGRGEESAWAFHLVNVLLHAGASAAVAELARRVTRSPPAGLIAGLLFVAHPIHVEAVTTIVGRAELMCGLGIFAALVLFFAPLTVRRAIAIWACFVVALLSKEQGMLLPLLLVVAIPARAQVVGAALASPSSGEVMGDTSVAPAENLSYASPSTPRRRRLDGASVLLLLLILWTLAVYIGFREHILKFWWDRVFLDVTINPMIESAGVHRWLLPVALFGRYVALLFAPLRLLPDYGGAVIGSRLSFADPYLYLGAAAAIALIVAGAVAYLRRRWTSFFCLIAFAALYGMIANFVTLIGVNFAERLMYIPSALFCILAAMLLIRLPRPAAIVVAVLAIVLLSARTVTYAARWNDQVTLFEQGIAQEPDSIRLYLLLAEEQQRHDDIPAARRTLARAREVLPTYYRIWLDSARLEMDARDYGAALRFAIEGQRLKPTITGTQLIRMIMQKWSTSQPSTATAPAP